MPSYGLTAAALPHSRDEHRHGHMQAHHSNSPSQGSSTIGSLGHSWTPPRPGKPNGAAHHHHGHGHGHGHEHEHEHEAHNHTHYRANSSHPVQPRHHLPPPPLLPGNNGWTTTVTPGGKAVITPTPATTTTWEKGYEAPAPSTFPLHDHGAQGRSRLTNLLLPLTARYPLLHAIVAEKDSRRIFYFMTYVMVGPRRGVTASFHC